MCKILWEMISKENRFAVAHVPLWSIGLPDSTSGLPPKNHILYTSILCLTNSALDGSFFLLASEIIIIKQFWIDEIIAGSAFQIETDSLIIYFLILNFYLLSKFFWKKKKSYFWLIVKNCCLINLNRYQCWFYHLCKLKTR